MKKMVFCPFQAIFSLPYFFLARKSGQDFVVIIPNLREQSNAHVNATFGLGE